MADAASYGLTPAEVERRRAAALAALSSYPLARHLPRLDMHVIEVGEGGEQAVAAELMAGGGFEWVEPDWYVRPVDCPDDPLLSNQWHHDPQIMNSCDGWDIETGSPETVVAICDTGIRTTHDEFQLHRQEGYHAPTGLWENEGGPVFDVNGHGTATTGCAAANGDNGIGVSGTGWNLGHRMMRVTDSPAGTALTTDLYDAARTAADAGDAVVSVSFSGAGASGIETTGAYVRSKGSLLFWSAGNEGNNLSGNRDDSVVYVGATTQNDTLSSFSNFGPLVDLVAPGSSVYTTNFTLDNTYGSVSGTSFSCPLTAGLAGLVWSRNPELTPQEVEDFLRAGCDDLGKSGVDNVFGYGRIDVGATLALVPAPGSGEVYCDESQNPANTADISISGTSLSEGITVDLSNAPPDMFAYLLVSDTNGTLTDPPGAGGDLCLTPGPIGRYAKDLGKIGAGGTLSTDIQDSQSGGPGYGLPNPPGGSIGAGDTWYFQYWHRNPTGPSGFSSAIEVVFEN